MKICAILVSLALGVGVGVGQVPRVVAPAMGVFHVFDGGGFSAGCSNSAAWRVLTAPAMGGIGSNVVAGLNGSVGGLFLSEAAARSKRWTLMVPRGATASDWRSRWACSFQFEEKAGPTNVPGFFSRAEGNRLIVGPSSGPVDSAVAPWRLEFMGAAEAGQVLPDAQFLVWADGKSWMESKSGFFPSSWMPVFKGWGLGDLGSVVSSGVFGANGTRLRVAFVFPGGLHGLPAVFLANKGQAEPPSFVPLNVMDYSRWRADWGRVFDSVVTGLWGERYLEQPLFVVGRGEGTTSIREGFSQFLGDDLVRYRFRPSGFDMASLAAGPEVWFVSSADPESLATGVRGMLTHAYGQDLTFFEEKLHGLPVVRVEAHSPETRLPVGGRSLSLLVGRGGVWMASSSVLFEDLWASPSQSLANSKSIGRAAGLVGGYGSSSHVVNQQLEAKVWWGILKGLPAGASGLRFPGFQVDFPSWFNAANLPAFEELKAAFGFGVYELRFEEKAVVVEYFSPR